MRKTNQAMNKQSQMANSLKLILWEGVSVLEIIAGD